MSRWSVKVILLSQNEICISASLLSCEDAWTSTVKREYAFLDLMVHTFGQRNWIIASIIIRIHGHEAAVDEAGVRRGDLGPCSISSSEVLPYDIHVLDEVCGERSKQKAHTIRWKFRTRRLWDLLRIIGTGRRTDAQHGSCREVSHATARRLFPLARLPLLLL